MDLMTATPTEIDTALADLYGKAQGIGRRISQTREYLMHYAGARRVYGRRTALSNGWSMGYEEAETKVRDGLDALAPWDQRSVKDLLDRLDQARAEQAANFAEQRKYGEEFQRRGGWTRAYLVTDGHVHSSMDCSTCNNGADPTMFTWLPQYSGHDEAEIIEVAAERACTVCYPNAPVETAGASVLMTPDERTRAEQRADAAKAKDERLAKKIANGLTADGSEFVVTYPGRGSRKVPNPNDPTGRTMLLVDVEVDRRESFKTERAAVQWVVQYKVWGDHGGDNRQPAFDAIIAAVAAKHGQEVSEVEAMIAAKVAAKIKRDSR